MVYFILKHVSFNFQLNLISIYKFEFWVYCLLLAKTPFTAKPAGIAPPAPQKKLAARNFCFFRFFKDFLKAERSGAEQGAKLF
jgi:hypothetical protein